MNSFGFSLFDIMINEDIDFGLMLITFEYNDEMRSLFMIGINNFKIVNMEFLFLPIYE